MDQWQDRDITLLNNTEYNAIQYQIIERSKTKSKNKPIYKNILKSIRLYLRAMNTFVSELVCVLCFFLLGNDVTEREIGIH